MSIDKRYKIATLMAAIAGVPDARFAHAGYSDDKMVSELVLLQPTPELLGRYVVDLGRAYGVDRMKEFEIKLDLAVNEIPDGHSYLEMFRRAKASITDVLKNATHAQMVMSLPFDSDLPSITSVMGHIEAERQHSASVAQPKP